MFFLSLAVLLLGCEKEGGNGLRKSDIVGSWERSGVIMKINNDMQPDPWPFLGGSILCLVPGDISRV